MEVTDGGGGGGVLFLRSDLKTRCRVLPTKLKAKITHLSKKVEGTALSQSSGGRVNAQ